MLRKLMLLVAAGAVAAPMAVTVPAAAHALSIPEARIRSLMPSLARAVIDAPLDSGRLARDAAAGWLDARAAAGPLLRQQMRSQGFGAPAVRPLGRDLAASLTRLAAISGADPAAGIRAAASLDPVTAESLAGIVDAIGDAVAPRVDAWRAVTPASLAAIEHGGGALRPTTPARSLSLLAGVTERDVAAFEARRALIDAIDLESTLMGATVIADAVDAAVARLGAGRVAVAAGTPSLVTIPTGFGDIVVKGPGADSNDEDALLLVDLGGNDQYSGRTASATGDPNPLLAYAVSAATTAAGGGVPAPPPPSVLEAAIVTRLVIDLGGDDIYGSGFDGNQGYGAAGGVGMLIDVAGNDAYRGGDAVQGSGFLGGVGVLVDGGGANTFLAGQKAQGFSQTGGVGVLASGTGTDTYEAFVFAQGTGFDGGAGGSLIDAGGNDSYRCVGEVNAADVVLPVSQSRPSTGCHGTGFGGQGILVDGGGDDLYFVKTSFQTMALIGAGMLFDAGGRDTFDGGEWSNAMAALGVAVLVTGSGDTTYTSAQRTHPLSAWADLYLGANGEGYSGGVAVLSDGGGDDSYIASADKGRWMQQWSCSAGCAFADGVGVLDDAGGNDRYSSEVGQGSALGGIAALIDARGNDSYSLILGETRGQGFGDPNPVPGTGVGLFQCGISYLVDGDGTDSYSNPVTQSGSRGDGRWWTAGTYGRGADAAGGIAGYAQSQLASDVQTYVNRRACTA